MSTGTGTFLRLERPRISPKASGGRRASGEVRRLDETQDQNRLRNTAGDSCCSECLGVVRGSRHGSDSASASLLPDAQPITQRCDIAALLPRDRRSHDSGRDRGRRSGCRRVDGFLRRDSSYDTASNGGIGRRCAATAGITAAVSAVPSTPDLAYLHLHNEVSHRLRVFYHANHPTNSPENVQRYNQPSDSGYVFY